MSAGASYGSARLSISPWEQSVEPVDFLAGDTEVRSALYAAANIILTRSSKWSSLKASGVRLSRSKGRERALVAIARKHVEQFFNRIKHCRQVATRYEKLAANYLAFVKLASASLLLRFYESTS